MGIDSHHAETSALRQRAPRYGAATGADMLDLCGFLGILRRPKYLIAGLTMVATFATALIANQMTPQFGAQATIVTDNDLRKSQCRSLYARPAVLTRVNVHKYAQFDDGESGLNFNRAYRNHYARAWGGS